MKNIDIFCIIQTTRKLKLIKPIYMHLFYNDFPKFKNGRIFSIKNGRIFSMGVLTYKIK